MKNILLYSMFTFREYEQGFDNTNCQILRWLKTRSDVDKIIFIDLPRLTLKSKIKYNYQNKFFTANKKTLWRSLSYRLDRIDDKILHYSGFNYRGIQKLVTRLKLENIESWSFNPLDLSFIEDFPASKKIFYAIDNWRENQLFSKFSDLLTANYKKIGEKADFVFTPSAKLKAGLWPDNPKVKVIPNGVDIEHFQHPEKVNPAAKSRIDDLLQGIKQKILGYFGVITPERVDFNLVESIVKNNPDLFFIFAGPVWGGFKSDFLIKKYKNIRFIGPVFYQEMPYLISRFAVAMIPHQVNEFTGSMDPKKLYEFLAAGKPIVSSKIAGSDKFESVIYLAKSPEDFSQKIKQALQEDSPALIQKRFQAVAPADWQMRFREIEKILGLDNKNNI